MGEDEDPRLDILLNHPVKWTKLTHDDGTRPGAQSPILKTLATYKLVPKEEVPDLSGKTHFYWTSGTSFERALQAYPNIKAGFHACGPGNTFLKLREILGPQGKLAVYPSHSLWLTELGVKK